MNLEHCLSFPMTPNPPSLSHHDGSLRKTDKPPLLKALEGMVERCFPNKPDTVIVDGFFLLHSLPPLPRYLRDVTRMVMKTLVGQTTSRADLVFDTYVSPSIKDVERSARGESNARNFSFGPAQTTPRDFKNLLKLSTFKVAMALFLLEDMSSQENADILSNNTIYCSVNHGCSCIFVENGLVCSETV